MSNFRPKGAFPNWATDDSYTSGPNFGLPTKISPLTGEKAQGHGVSMRPAPQKENWLKNSFSQWITYLADVGILNWGQLVQNDTTPSALDLSVVRADGSTKPFYNEAQLYWVLSGKNTNGGYYIGDDSGVFALLSTGSAFKFSFGCGTADGRNLLFSAAVAGVGPQYSQSDITGTAGWTDKHLAYPGGATVTAQDCAVFPNGDIVFVGGAVGNVYAWTSTDNGGTSTAHVVDFLTFSPASFHRVVIGASDRCFAWLRDVAAHNGDRVYYSDDHGVTWTMGASFGFDTIRDILWMPDEGIYIVATDTGLYSTADPALGATAIVAISTGASAVWKGAAVAGSVVIASLDNSGSGGQQVTEALWDRCTEARTIHRNLLGTAPNAVAVNSRGQFLLANTVHVRLSLALSGVPRN